MYTLELPYTLYLHVKRNTNYRALGYGQIQASRPLLEGELVMVYIAENGKMWVRPGVEFDDGRFVKLEDYQQPGPDPITGADCKGSWSFGTACGDCPKCHATLSQAAAEIRYMIALHHAATTNPPQTPIPMRLTCPSCGVLHIDTGRFTIHPHHTHACQACGNTWRPAIVPTVGVRFLPSFKDEA